jgi:iron(III) transport system substrate-binding protein
MSKEWFLWVVTAALVAVIGAAPSLAAPAGGSQLVVYTARDKSIFDYVVAQFEARYPQFRGNVQVLNMGAQEVFERVRAERANPQGDIWWGGTQQAFSLAAREGLLEPVRLAAAQRIPANYRDRNNRWYGEILLPEVIMTNSQAVPAAQAPRDWDDLLEARWKGKIIIRAVAPSGTMRTIYTAMIARFYRQDNRPDRGYEWLRKLDANTKEYAANPTTLYLKLARQEGILSLWNLQDILIQRDRSNMPFGFVMPTSGAPILVDGVGMIRNTKRAQAAELFLNFLFEPAIRTELADKYYQIPTVPLQGGRSPQWLREITMKPMDLPWDLMAEKEREWIEYWDQNIKGKGG